MTTFLPQDSATHDNLEDCEAEVKDLRAALHTRPVIDQAKGMLIAEHGCTAEEAFQMLAGASQRHNRRVRDLAQAMVDGAQTG